MRFTLRSGEWYACEFIGDEYDQDKCSYSPIKIQQIEPCKTGKREVVLSFYHANYPEGVRDKKYRLQTIERGETFLLAKSLDHSPSRLLQIYKISSDWISNHFGINCPNDIDVNNWLERNA